MFCSQRIKYFNVVYSILLLQKVHSEDKICDTNICKRNVDFFMETMNLTFDPCKSFYQFTCGERLINSQLRFATNILSEMNEDLNSKLLTVLSTKSESSEPNGIKKMKQFYSSCLKVTKEDVTNVSEIILKVYNDLGGSPITNPNWSVKNFNLWSVVAKMIRYYDIAPFFNVQVHHDEETPRHLHPFITGSMAFFSVHNTDNQTVFTDKFAKKANRMYENYKDRGSKDSIRETLTTGIDMMKDVATLQMELVKLSNVRSGVEDFQITTIKKLQKETDSLNLSSTFKIDWVEFFKIIFQGTNVPVSSSMKIGIAMWDSIKNLMSYLNSMDKLHVLANYMTTHFVEEFHSKLTKEFSDNIGLTEVGVKVNNERPCVLYSKQFFGFALGYQYLKKNKNDKIIEKVKDLAQSIKDELRRRLMITEIFNDSDRKRAIEKLAAMKLSIGYRTSLMDSTKLESEHKDLSLGDFYFENLKNVINWRQRNRLNLIFTQDLDLFWTRMRYPLEANIAYSLKENMLYVLNPLLNFPIYEMERPSAINLAMLGSLISQEMIYGFSLMGCNFDNYGNWKPWLSTQSNKQFKERTKCHIDYYRNIKLDEFRYFMFDNTTINSIQTLDANLADIDGLTITYSVFNKNQTSNNMVLGGELSPFKASELFFISFSKMLCEVHSHDTLWKHIAMESRSPKRYRVMGSLVHSPYFNRVFNCPGECRRKCTIL